MKKTFIIAATLVVTSVSSFAQGYISWAGGLHGLINNYTTPGTPAYTSGIDAALLFYTGSAPAFTSVASSSNSVTALPTGDWASLLNGAIVVDGTVNGTQAVTPDTVSGSLNYNSGNAWDSDNIAGGTLYNVVEIAWSTDGGLYTTVAAASGANMTLGWTAAFTYTPATGPIGVPQIGLGNEGLQTGVDDVVSSIPEPCTMALAGLGGLGLLALRRKK